MKITRGQLRKIIKEELLKEAVEKTKLGSDIETAIDKVREIAYYISAQKMDAVHLYSKVNEGKAKQVLSEIQTFAKHLENFEHQIMTGLKFAKR